jgi:hypothetical protein
MDNDVKTAGSESLFADRFGIALVRVGQWLIRRGLKLMADPRSF